jgi:peptidyl-prolyl cis-trans isomerase B (cyclophilin B)
MQTVSSKLTPCRRNFLSRLLQASALTAAVLTGKLAYAADSTPSTNSQPTKGKTSMSTQPRVKISTNFGDMIISVDAAKAPKTAANFIAYVKDGFYDGTIFHRVMDGFMVQGGGFEPGMKQKATKAPVENEANNGLKNNKYTLAMARTSDPHSATGQFFINVANNDFLNHTAPTAQGWGYAVFGEVVEGQDVVDKIKAVKTGNSGFHQNVPTEDVIITKAVVLE